jgi:hypothetical protein
MPKQRGEKQSTGRRGEEAFRLFASRHGVLASRMEEDIGFDFVCMVEQPGLGGMRTLSGTWLGVSVRSTRQRSGRVRLNRSDAEAMLRASFPVCFVLVEVQRDTERLSYRFLDESFAQELSDFLASERLHMSLTPSKCRSGASFDEDLRAMLRGNRAERVRLAVARHRIERHLSGALLHVERTDAGELTVVTVPDFFSYFRRDEATEQERVHAAIFGSPERRMQRLADIGPRPEVLKAIEDLPSALLVGATDDDAVRIVAQDESGCGVVTFERVRDASHTGWVHPAGFSLTVSARVLRNDRWVHEMAVLFDPDQNCDLRAHPELWTFLEHCDGETAVLYREGDPSRRIPADFFAGLRRVSFFARCLRAAARITGVDPAGGDVLDVPLRDCLDDEALHALAWLAEIATRPQILDGFGFVIDERPVVEMTQSRMLVGVPIIANLAAHAVVTWLEADATIYEVGDRAVGIRIDSTVGAAVERREPVQKSSRYPELVVHGSWPTVALSQPPTQTGSDPAEWGLDLRLPAYLDSHDDADDAEFEPGR